MDVPPQRGPTANKDPTAPRQPRPFSPSPLPSPIEGEGGASKPYGADGRIAEKTGVVNTFFRLRIAVRPRHACRARADFGLRIERPTRLRPAGYAVASGNGFEARSLGCARDDNLTTHGEIPPLAALGRDDSTRAKDSRRETANVQQPTSNVQRSEEGRAGRRLGL